MGKGVLKAVANVNDIIGPAIIVRGIIARHALRRTGCRVLPGVGSGPRAQGAAPRAAAEGAAARQQRAPPGLRRRAPAGAARAGARTARLAPHRLSRPSGAPPKPPAPPPTVPPPRRACAPQGKNPTEQKALDDLMISLDGTDNKGKLGANAILAVSMAVCKVCFGGGRHGWGANTCKDGAEGGCRRL